MRIWKEFTFESAHSLPNVPPGHRCSRLHGHSYLVRLTVEGAADPHTGWVMDFSDIKALWQGISVDHRLLNDIPGLENPTCENLAMWIHSRLTADLPNLTVDVRETATCGAQYP